MNIEVKKSAYTFEGIENKFSFYTNLTAVNKVKFVNSVVDLIVGENYHSIIRNMMFDFGIVNIFTDIDLTDIYESGDKLSEIEKFLSETNIVKIVKSNMVDGLLNDLNKAVDDSIAYKTGVHRNSLSDALSELLVTLNKKISSVDTEAMFEAAKKLNSMTGELTTESILEAYAKSDLFKRDIEKDKKDKHVRSEFVDHVIKN